MKKIKIEIGGEMSGPNAEMLKEAETADKEMMTVASPKGNFTPRGLGPLVKATNKLLPLFGQTGDYPALAGSLKELPEDFTRVISMFKAAVDDAIAEEVVGPEMAISLDSIIDDTGLLTLAGKLEMLAKTREFKKFLSEPPKGETQGTETGEEAGMPEEEMSSENADQLMMNRM